MNASRQLSRVLVAATLIAAGAVTSACGDDDDTVSPDGGRIDGGVDGGIDGGIDGSVPSDASVGDAGTAAIDVASKAADLRTALNLKLSEHLVLASKATGSALAGRVAESTAYATLVNTNGTDLGAMIGAAFGAPAQTRFNELWSAHNGYFLQYTTGVATSNETLKTQAVTDLTTKYVPDFAAFLATPTGLPDATLRTLLATHVTQTKNIVDAQAAARVSNDYGPTYAAIRLAFAHMAEIGNPLSIAIAGKVPATFTGNAGSKAAEFRSKLNQALQEHLYLASFATRAALAANTNEANAAVAALNANGTEIGAVITQLYNAEAGTAFNSIWSAHNGYFVNYVTGVATNNEGVKTQAVSDLTTKYVPQFTGLLVSATGLPQGTVSALVAEHVTKTKAIVDAQAITPVTETSATATVTADRGGAVHMQMLGDPLAKAIVGSMPAKF